MTIDWTSASTKRGAVWVITAVVGSVFVFMGKPVDQLLLLAGAVAGDTGSTGGAANFSAGSAIPFYVKYL